MPDAAFLIALASLALIAVVNAVRKQGRRRRAAATTPAAPEAESKARRRSRLSAEAVRLYEEAGAGWWSEVWGPKHPDPPYDWAQEGDSGSAFVGAGRGRAI